MLVYFTDAVSQQQVAVNPNYVTCVFVAKDGDMAGKTVIAMTSGTLIVEQTQTDVVGVLQGQMNQ
jgi:hypothetical protein